jgi:hypothetical protein
MTEQELQLFFKIIEEEKSKFKHKAVEFIAFTKSVFPVKAMGNVSLREAYMGKRFFDTCWLNAQSGSLQTQQIKTIENDIILGFYAGCYQQKTFEHIKIKPEIRLCTDCLKGN